MDKNKSIDSNSNYYAALDLDEMSDDEVSPEQSTKKARVPPVVVKNLSKEETLSLLKKSNINSYNLKLMSIGIKVLFETDDDRELFVAALKRNGVGFFSYASKESRPMKFVISGLDYYSTEVIFSELSANNIPCADVKHIKLKNQRFNAQTNYLVFFKKGVISFAELKKFRSLFNTIIYWSPWRRSKNAVTQCYRCQMFGHGEDHCHLPTKCQNCAGVHLTKDCNVSRIKCANCGECQIASDHECPKRREYLYILNKMQSRSRNFKRPQPQNNINFSDNNFPALQKKPAVNVPPPNNNNRSYASAAKADNLFTSNELISITRELLTSLRGASSKEDQIMAIAAIVTKFVYND